MLTMKGGVAERRPRDDSRRDAGRPNRAAAALTASPGWRKELKKKCCRMPAQDVQARPRDVFATSLRPERGVRRILVAGLAQGAGE